MQKKKKKSKTVSGALSCAWLLGSRGPRGRARLVRGKGEPPAPRNAVAAWPWLLTEVRREETATSA